MEFGQRHTLLALTQLILTPRLGDKSIDKVLRSAADAGLPLPDYLKRPLAQLAGETGLGLDVLRAIPGARAQAEQLADDLFSQHADVLLRHHAGYPAHLNAVLANDAPPYLFCRGDLSLLEAKAVGVGGSRKASNLGLTLAEKTGYLLAQDRVNIVSGYANGVDLAAHKGALRAGKDSGTTIVLAEGLLNFTTKREIRALLQTGRSLILSEFPPALSWIARNAMRRNKTILGLSDAFVIVEAGLDGGTFEAGKAALARHVPLFVVSYTHPPVSALGNAHFLALPEVHPILMRGDEPNLEPMVRLLDAQPEPAPVVAAGPPLQLSLGLN